MCKDIRQREAFNFTKKFNAEHKPLYGASDVEKSLEHLRGVEANEIIEITENVSLQFVPAGHIYGSCQIVLYIKRPTGGICKIAYSGDLETLSLTNHLWKTLKIL